MSKFYSLIISRLIVPLFSWEFAKDNYHSEKLQTKEESELESLTWFYFFACSDFGIISLVLPPDPSFFASLTVTGYYGT